ncbi:MAG: response regulator [Spirochaetota bacterium]|nr:response regulator [Spirochaetota bacterium]
MKYIMTIDDSLTIRTSVDFALKGLGHAVKQAENGADALEKINELKSNGDDVSLCIVDVNMPIMDGITFVKEFRKLDKFTPVLVLTTESEGSKIQEGKQAGASGWLVKPFKSDELIGVVQKLIR